MPMKKGSLVNNFYIFESIFILKRGHFVQYVLLSDAEG